MTTLRAGELEAVWLPEHGMVGSSLRHRGQELLGQRDGLEAYLDKGSAFGIPLLSPWANRLDGLRYGEVVLEPSQVKLDGAGLPKDGVMAGRAWTVDVVTEDALKASFTADAPVLAVFPFPHRLTVRVTLRPSVMTVATTLAATGDVPVPIAFGWHPLFTLPGVPRAQLELVLPVRRELALDARGIPTGACMPVTGSAGAPPVDRTLDAEYDAWAGNVVLRGGGRELRVAFCAPGYPVGHVWAPAGHDFVAWEPMTAPTNALVSGDGLRHVAPGDAFSATFSVHVTDAPEPSGSCGQTSG